MLINVREKENVLIVYLEGSLDLHHVETFNDLIAGYLEKGYKYFVFNMHGVNFLSMVGVGVLVAIFKRIRDIEGFLALTHVDHVVREILGISKFEELFLIYDTEEDALEALRKGEKMDVAMDRSRERRYPRVPLAVPVRCQRSTCSIEASTKNISEGGFFIKTDSVYDVGSVLNLYLDLNGHSLSVVVCVAWVADKYDQGDYYPGMGVEIVGIDPADLRRLKAFLDEHAEDASA